MTHHTERPDFPMDALTADERRAAAEYAAKRDAWRPYAAENPNSYVARVLEAGDEARAFLEERRVQREVEEQLGYNDGDPVAPTLRNFLAMSAAAATVIVVAGVIYLEFAALAH